MLEGALDRVQGLDRDLVEPVVGSLQDLKRGPLEELLRQSLQEVPGQIDHPQFLVVVEHHGAEGGQLVALEVDGLQLGRGDEAPGFEDRQGVEAEVEKVEALQLTERLAGDVSQDVPRQVQHLENVLEWIR